VGSHTGAQTAVNGGLELLIFVPRKTAASRDLYSEAVGRALDPPVQVETATWSPAG
jgi:hypothetical protein